MVVYICFLIFFSSWLLLNNGIAQTGQDDANSGQDAPGFVDDEVCPDFIPINLDVTYTSTLGASLTEGESEDVDAMDCFSLVPIDNSPGYLRTTVSFIDHDTIPSFKMILSYKDIGMITSSNTEVDFFLPITKSDQIIIQFDGFRRYSSGWGDPEYELLTYQFSFSFTEEAVNEQNDGGFGMDAPDTSVLDFPEVNFDETYFGQIGYGQITGEGLADEMDIYEINIEERGFFTISVTATTTSTGDEPEYNGYKFIQLEKDMDQIPDWHYSYRFYLDGITINHISTESPETSGFIRAIEEPGTYYIIWSNEYSELFDVNYLFTTSFEPDPLLPQNDGNYRSDAPWFVGINYDPIVSPLKSVVHELNTTIVGTIGTTLNEGDSLDTQDAYLLPNIYYGTLEIDVEFIDNVNQTDELNIRLLQDFCSTSADDRHENEYIFSYIATPSSYNKNFVDASQSQCINTDGIYYKLILSTEDEFINYRIRLNYILDVTEIQEDEHSERLYMNSELILTIGGLIASLSIAGYFVNTRLINDIIKISKNVEVVVKEIFNGKTAGFLLLGQNFVGKDNINEIVLREDFPPELLQERFLLHPVRLAMCKILANNPQITSSDLRIRLGISWGDYTGHTKALGEKGYILLEDKIIDGIKKQVISLEPLGITKFRNLVDLLDDYLDETIL